MLIFNFQTIKQKLGMNLSLNPVSFTDIYMKNISCKYLSFIYINQIMFRLDDGLVDLLFQINSNVLKNHLIFSYAFSEFYDRYKKGRGRVYVANARSKKSSIIGFFPGIIYWFFCKGVC